MDSQEENILLSVGEEITLVSVVGTGINFKSDVMTKVLSILDDMNISPETYSFSETRISIGLHKKYVNEVASNMHQTLIVQNCQNRIKKN